jgi:hypothetical protein
MAKYKKKGDPELMLISFCDIVTVTCVALFMAMIIVIWEAIKTPEIRATPLAAAVTNAPVYFECRNNQLFPVNRDAFVQQIRSSAAERKAAAGSTSEQGLQSLMKLDLADDFYKVSNNHLLVGMIALQPRPEATGLDEAGAIQTNSLFHRALAAHSPDSHYLVFYVRDDSFPIFRKVRDLAAKAGWNSGWEYLDRTEPVTFAGIMGRIGSQ